MTQGNYTSVVELDADYERELTVDTAKRLMALTGPTFYVEAMQEVQARQFVCGITKLEALRLVLDAYKGGAR